jgi:hypothetical protein
MGTSPTGFYQGIQLHFLNGNVVVVTTGVSWVIVTPVIRETIITWRIGLSTGISKNARSCNSRKEHPFYCRSFPSLELIVDFHQIVVFMASI